MVGDNYASSIYVEKKKQAALYLNIDFYLKNFSNNCSQLDLNNYIIKLNKDDTVSAILLQMPLLDHINAREALDLVDHTKDVDCLGSFNIGKLLTKTQQVMPCTPYGILEILKTVVNDFCNKKVVVIGRSILVGKSIAIMLENLNATVTNVHRYSSNIEDICKSADILIVAIGKARHINKKYIKNGAIVIDVGINKDESGNIAGDVDYLDVIDGVNYITPVPNGVGPMTIYSLMYNIVKLFKLQNNLD